MFMLLPFAIGAQDIADQVHLARACLRDLRVEAVVTRLADLPADVRAGLSRLGASPHWTRIADSDEPLLQTDAPSAAEREYPRARFAQAVRVRDRWFVQFEATQEGGVRTVGFERRLDGRFSLSRLYTFGGPACASIKAALAGVWTPGGFGDSPPDPEQ